MERDSLQMCNCKEFNVKDVNLAGNKLIFPCIAVVLELTCDIGIAIELFLDKKRETVVFLGGVMITFVYCK